jgi:hypothetical protein
MRSGHGPHAGTATPFLKSVRSTEFGPSNHAIAVDSARPGGPEQSTVPSRVQDDAGGSKAEKSGRNRPTNRFSEEKVGEMAEFLLKTPELSGMVGAVS